METNTTPVITQQELPQAPRSNPLVMVLLVSNILFIGLLGFAIFQIYTLKSQSETAQVSVVEPVPMVSPSSEPNAMESDPSRTTYQSNKYNYTFSYPKTWHFSPYAEDNPEVKFGSHVLTNYSVTDIEQYMDHGTVDWAAFMGSTPAVKIDFSVIELDESQRVQFLEDFQKNNNANQQPTSDIRLAEYQIYYFTGVNPLTNEESSSYVAFLTDTTAIYLHLYYSNIASKEALKQTATWNELETIFSSFNFK